MTERDREKERGREHVFMLSPSAGAAPPGARRPFGGDAVKTHKKEHERQESRLFLTADNDDHLSDCTERGREIER